MNEQISNLASAYLPDILVTLPWIGEVDFTPYLTALVIFAVLTLVFWILQRVIVSKLKSFSKKTRTDIDDVVINAVDGIRSWVYSLVAFYIALQIFELPETLSLIITGIVYFAVVWQVIEMAVKFVDYSAHRFLQKDADGDGAIDPGAATASDLVTLMARIVFWSLGALFVLSNLGIEITSLIAGLGIGGIAVAFALQGILSDLFASFSIYFDRPFRVGDFIVIGNDMGTVERIGIKSTRIRTLQGEELVVSNAELTTARVQNFKKMSERRIVATFGVTYETPQELVQEIPSIVQDIFTNIEESRLDRVHFTSFGDFALLFELVYYIESSDYNVYMDHQQQFNFELMQRFAEKGIEFAYPTQTLRFDSSNVLSVRTEKPD